MFVRGELNLAHSTLTLTNAAANVTLAHVFGAGEIVLQGEDDSVNAFTLTLQGDVDLVNAGKATFTGQAMRVIEPYATITAEPGAGKTITISNLAGATWIDAAPMTFQAHRQLRRRQLCKLGRVRSKSGRSGLRPQRRQ